MYLKSNTLPLGARSTNTEDTKHLYDGKNLVVSGLKILFFLFWDFNGFENIKKSQGYENILQNFKGHECQTG